MSAATSHRSPAGPAQGEDVTTGLLAGIVTDETEEFPVAKRGREAKPVPAEIAATLAAMLAGTVRFSHMPARDEDGDAKRVTNLKSNVTKWLKAEGLDKSHRPEYSSTGTDKSGAVDRVAFRIVKR